MTSAAIPDPPAAPSEPASPKRRAVLDAANELFMAEGYGAVSMDAVARAAGVSKATLYAHFGAKERLFAAIMAEACQAMRSTAAMDADAQEGGPRRALTAMGRRWLGFLLEERILALRRIVVAEGPRFPELARTFYANGPRATRDWLARWIEGERARGRLRCPDPDLAAAQFIALLTGDIVLRATLGLDPRPDAAEIERHVAAAVDTFCRAFAAEGPAANTAAAPG